MPMDPDLIEQLAEAVHQGWMAEKIAQGFADHVYSPVRDNDLNPLCLQASPHGGSAYCYLPEAKHHTDMLPYAELAEPIKEYDRATVRAVLRALDAAGLYCVGRDLTVP